VGSVIHPRLILLLLGLWACSAAGQSETDSLPDAESATTPSRPVPVPYTKTVTQSAASKPPASQTSEHIMPLEVVINGAKSGTWLLLERDGDMYAPYDAFIEWRVQLPADAKPIDFKLFDQAYWPLSAIPGYKFKLDIANQSAELLFSPQAFSATRLTQEKSKRPVISPVLPSLFLNYDWNYQVSSLRNAATVRDLGLLTEIGASSSWGVLTSSHVGRNLTIDAASGTPHSWVRLETTFTRDFPEQNRTLRMGDTATRAGMWGRSVYFGGIQYGSNFALTPGFVSQPVPALLGISTAPSTVEMYVNDVLRQVSSVPTGPFAIDNSPLLTGSGDVRMVVRDILGRETVIEQTFFTTTELLSAGLNDWSIEAGSLRNDLGVASNHYGPGFASGTWRHGHSNHLTLEGRAEATPQLRTVGLGILSTMPRQMLGKASLGISNGQNQNGGLLLLGLEHQSLHHSVAFQVQGASRNFHQLGQPENVAPIKLQLAGNWSYTSGSTNSYGIGLANISRFDGSSVSTVSGNYSTRIGERGDLTFTVSRAINGVNGMTAGVFYVMSLDDRRVISAYASEQDSYVSAMKNPDYQNNLGWRALAGHMQSRAHLEGGLNYLGRYGQLIGDASTSPDQSTLRLGANGGLILADNSLFATERGNQSFALVEVPGYDNIGVGLGNNVLTHTNDSGVALVPRLMPYQNNSVRLSPDDLPISAEIENIEQYVVPAWRSAVKVVFPVRGGRGALLKIIFDDGQPAPAGAVVNIEGDKEEFYVARRGEAFVTGLQPSNLVVLSWKGQQCKFNVTLPTKTQDDIPRIGPLVCKGITR
jgi:outer membrane usher protein